MANESASARFHEGLLIYETLMASRIMIRAVLLAMWTFFVC